LEWPERAASQLGEETMAESELYRKGLDMRRKLRGEADFQKNQADYSADPMMKKFIDVATETVFGGLWARPGLDLKTRTLICVISDAATGREPELDIHLRFALKQGWTEEELSEALLHLSGYVGVPLIREAMLVASRVFKEEREKAKA
jgi:4-carboxymuconolactone decarboxylase